MGLRLSRDRKVFARPLHKTVKGKESNIPAPLALGIAFIEEHALEFQGLYRVPGSKAKIMLMAEEFDSGAVPNFASYGSANTSGLIKLFLAQLPEPVSTYDAYDRFVEIGATLDAEATQGLGEIKAQVDALPPVNRDVLGFLVRHLEVVSRHKAANSMSDVNLALVFSPSLFKSRDDSPIKCLQDTPALSKLLLTMMRNHATLFSS